MIVTSQNIIMLNIWIMRRFKKETKNVLRNGVKFKEDIKWKNYYMI